MSGLTAEQREWIRRNLPGKRARVPSMAEAVRACGVPLPPQAALCCQVITPDEAADMALEARRERVARAAARARVLRENEWAEFYEEEDD